MSFTKIETKDMKSTEEILGTMQYSILSSMVGLHKLGMPSSEILEIKKHIEGLNASLWSIFVLSVKKENEKELEKVEETLLLLNRQIQDQLNEIKFISQNIWTMDLH